MRETFLDKLRRGLAEVFPSTTGSAFWKQIECGMQCVGGLYIRSLDSFSWAKGVTLRMEPDGFALRSPQHVVMISREKILANFEKKNGKEMIQSAVDELRALCESEHK